MPVLVLRKPFTTTVPTLKVENVLAPGVHVFQLVVVNAQGVQSDPVRISVAVTRVIVPSGPGRPGLIGGLATPAPKQRKKKETAQHAGAEPVPPAGTEKKAAAQPARAAKGRPKAASRKPKQEAAEPAAKKSRAVAPPKTGAGAKRKKISATRKKRGRKAD
jgi:hypothetical protein